VRLPVGLIGMAAKYLSLTFVSFEKVDDIHTKSLYLV
jgi:hypothetical protein